MFFCHSVTRTPHWFSRSASFLSNYILIFMIPSIIISMVPLSLFLQYSLFANNCGVRSGASQNRKRKKKRNSGLPYLKHFFFSFFIAAGHRQNQSTAPNLFSLSNSAAYLFFCSLILIYRFFIYSHFVSSFFVSLPYFFIFSYFFVLLTKTYTEVCIYI